MAELTNRDKIESDFAKRFGVLAGRHRRELDELLGEPPDAANVPQSFWEKVQRETEEEMVAILLFLFIAASSQHGMKDSQAAATGFALGRGAQVARSYTATSVDRTANNFDREEIARRDGPLPKAEREARLDKIFGQARVEELAVDNTTAANTAGGEAATAATVGLSPDDTWFTQGDQRVCPVCGPLHRKKREDWQRFFPSGPPSHPNCRCWIEYAREKQTVEGLLEHKSVNNPSHHKTGAAPKFPGKGRLRKVKAQEMRPKTKSEIAKASHKMVDATIQRYSEEHNESRLAKRIGGKSLPNGEPHDIELMIGNKRHGIELKTMVSNKANKLTMKRSAMERKAEWERKNKATMHTVVFDDEKVFNAGGEGKHDESKRRIFYRRGYGSMRVNAMYEVKGGVKELKQLVAADRKGLSKLKGAL